MTYRVDEVPVSVEVVTEIIGNNLHQETVWTVEGDLTIDVSGTVRLLAGKHNFIRSGRTQIDGWNGVGSVLFNTPEDENGNPILITQKFIPYRDRTRTILLRKKYVRSARCGCGR